MKVNIPDTYPTAVGSFASKADAEGWIANHKSRIAADSAATGRFHAPRTRTSSAAET